MLWIPNPSTNRAQLDWKQITLITKDKLLLKTINYIVQRKNLKSSTNYNELNWELLKHILII